MRYICNHWFHGGMILAALLAAYGAAAIHFMGNMEKILFLSFMLLLAHQWEEYIWPGGAPIVINRFFYGEKKDYFRYPGNWQSIMFVNVSAWIYYGAAVFLHDWIWPGIAVSLMGIMQFFGHIYQMNRKGRSWYNPGAATALLFLPLSVLFFCEAYKQQMLTGKIVFYGLLAFFILAVCGIFLPVQILKNRESGCPIPEKQEKLFEKVYSWAGLRPGWRNRNLLSHWYEISVPLGLAVLGAVFYGWDGKPLQTSLILLELALLLFHFFEEFGYPGGFPVMANAIELKSEIPDRYPLNQLSAAFGNYFCAVMFCLLPLFFHWLVLVPFVFGIMELVMHVFTFNRMIRSFYNPGMVTGCFMGIVGIYFMTDKSSAAVVTWENIMISFACCLAVYFFSFWLVGMGLMKNRESPYRFSREEMNRFKRFAKRKDPDDGR